VREVPPSSWANVACAAAGRALRVLRLVIVNLLVFAVLAELASLVLVRLERWPSTRPTYHLDYNRYWADIDSVFGAWHRPGHRFVHQIGCFSAVYSTNSYGARDVERTLRSSAPRTIMLGDSFVEGYGLSDEERLTNILERETGREHLNFGTSGAFSPLQYALLYESLASRFDHDRVLVGVLPGNDFWEMDGGVVLEGRYRPVYRGDLSIEYQGTFDPHAGERLGDRLEAVLRAYSASYHVGQYVDSRRRWHRLASFSGYNDFRDADLERLQASLVRIKRAADARGAETGVYLIPRADDFVRFAATGADRLGPLLERWGADVGIRVKDLLPPMAARSEGDYRPYFFLCDPHWSALGSATAAAIVADWLEEIDGPS